MTVATVAVVVAALLCLAFDTKKFIGVAGVALLIYFHPLLSTAFLVLGVAIFYFIRYHNKRSTAHGHSKLPSRRD